MKSGGPEQTPQVTSTPMATPGGANSDTGHVPVFGTWRRIYISVIVANLVAMALVYLFSRFPY